MLRGSCLCGAFQFELDRVAGPFEVCHCSRCRKVSGGLGMPAVGADAKDYRVIRGRDHLRAFEAPILESPPAYHVYFCATCATALPPPDPTGWFEIPAGLFDDDLDVSIDRRIFVEHRLTWEREIGELPEFTKKAIQAHRRMRS